MIDENDPLPDGSRIAPEERGRSFVQRLVTPAANPSYAVRLVVPRSWEPIEMPGADQPVSATRLTPLAGWQDPAWTTAPAMLHVQAVGLPRELTAEHFLIAYANEQEQRILALRGLADTLADAVVALRIKGHPCLARTVVLFDGDRAYVTTGVAHRDDYARYADTFGAMVTSLVVEQPTGRPHVEERVTRTILDTVAFDAPISFRALEARGGTDTHRALELFQKDPGGTFCGLIRVDLDLATRGASEEDELVYVAAHLMKRGITLGDEPKAIPIEGREDDPIRPLSMYRVEGTADDDSPTEAWFGLFRVHDRSDGAALRVWMVGPTGTSSFRRWAVNQRGFRVLVSSLRRATPTDGNESGPTR